MSGFAPPKGIYTIGKFFSFCASHTLDKLSEGHKCSNLHGHNYRVEIVLRSRILDQSGFVVDYGTLDEFGVWLNEEFDHVHLNDVLSFHPSAENLARHFYHWLKVRFPNLLAVRVSETPNTWAEYREEEE